MFTVVWAGTEQRQVLASDFFLGYRCVCGGGWGGRGLGCRGVHCGVGLGFLCRPRGFSWKAGGPAHVHLSPRKNLEAGT